MSHIMWRDNLRYLWSPDGIATLVSTLRGCLTSIVTSPSLVEVSSSYRGLASAYAVMGAINLFMGPKAWNAYVLALASTGTLLRVEGKQLKMDDHVLALLMNGPFAFGAFSVSEPLRFLEEQNWMIANVGGDAELEMNDDFIFRLGEQGMYAEHGIGIHISADFTVYHLHWSGLTEGLRPC